MVDPDLYHSGVELSRGNESPSPEDPLLQLASHLHLSGSQVLLRVHSTQGSRDLISLLPRERVEQAGRAAQLRDEPLSDQVLSLTVVGSELLELTRYGDGILGYRLKLEAFVRSPVIDDYLSDGNILLLAVGCASSGSANARDFGSPNALNRAAPRTIAPFADAYVVARSPYSNQYVILRVGATDPFSAGASVHASATIELPAFPRLAPPALLAWSAQTYDVASYLSLYADLIPADAGPGEYRLEAGLRFADRSSRKATVLYGTAELAPAFQIVGGLKMEL